MKVETSSVAPVAAVVAAMVSICLGATVAKDLFLRIGPAGTTALRLTLAALILALVFRVWRLPMTRASLVAGLPYGVCLGCMNLLFYMSIARIPLGIALALEFTGPLAVATVSSRRWTDILCVALAVTGLWLLLSDGLPAGDIDPVGAVLALTAGLFWAGYILAGQRAGRALGAPAPAIGMMVAAAVVLPFGLARAGTSLLDGRVLALGVVVALLSSAIPYSLEMFALRRLPAKSFGVLTSGEPAIGALVAALLLHEALSPLEWLGIGAIVAASLGATLTRERPSEPAADAAAP